MGFFAAKIVPLRPYTLLVRLKIREGFDPVELSEGFSTVCAAQRYRRSMRGNVRRWFERAAAAIWTAFVRWGRTGHAVFSWKCEKSAAQRYRSGYQKSLNKRVGGEASSLPCTLSSVFALEMGFLAAKIVPLCPYTLLVRLKIRQSARRRDTAVQREEMCGGDLDGFREMGGELGIRPFS